MPRAAPTTTEAAPATKESAPAAPAEAKPDEKATQPNKDGAKEAVPAKPQTDKETNGKAGNSSFFQKKSTLQAGTEI